MNAFTMTETTKATRATRAIRTTGATGATRFFATVAAPATIATFAVLTAFLLPAAMLTGCSEPQEKEPSAAVELVFTQSVGTKPLSWKDPSIREAFDPVVRGGGYYGLTLASSEPETIGTPKRVDYPINPREDALEERWVDSRDDFSDTQRIDSAVPKAEEIDLLEGIRLGGASLNTKEAQECDTRTLYVVSNGLSTSGTFDLAGQGQYGDILNGDIDAIIDAIKASTFSEATQKSEGYPDLTGIRVVWLGLGRITDSPQMNIDAEQVAQLQDMWNKVLLAANAESVEFRDYLSAGQLEIDKTEFPSVTPIVFETLFNTEIISFDENVLEFVGDEAIYKREAEDDLEYVHSILTPYAEALKQSKQTVVVLGTTAFGDKEECFDLGMRRATRFKDDLVSLGVDPNQIIVVSAGCDGVGVKIGTTETVDFYHDNFDAATGDWVEETARTNRAIHIVPVHMADDLIARFGSNA